MTQLMNGLHQDHQHISVLLTILKNKLATLELGSRPDFNLMADLVDYLVDYADQYHHPKEELIYGFLRTRYPDTAPLVDQQTGEHRELERLTRELHESIDRALIDAPVPLSSFIDQLRRFLDKQSDHLNREEEKLFPLIERTLTPENWMQVVADLSEQEDPLREGRLDERYRKLRDALIEDLGE